MRSCAKQGEGCHQGEQGEPQEAHPVQHHGCKLPVVLDTGVLLLTLDSICDGPQLPQDDVQLPGGGGGGCLLDRLCKVTGCTHTCIHTIQTTAIIPAGTQASENSGNNLLFIGF